jgi:hypothetical protein
VNDRSNLSIRSGGGVGGAFENSNVNTKLKKKKKEEKLPPQTSV